jgi:hypothetical protein
VAEKLVCALEPVIKELCRCRNKKDMEQELRLFILEKMLATKGQINSRILILQMGRHLENLQNGEYEKGWTEVPKNLSQEDRAKYFGEFLPDKYRYTERGRVAVIHNHLLNATIFEKHCT